MDDEKLAIEVEKPEQPEQPRNSRFALGVLLLGVVALAAVAIVAVTDDIETEPSEGDDVVDPPSFRVGRCLDELEIEVLFPNSEGYNLTYQFQLVSPVDPFAVASPQTEDDVADILACARLDTDMKVSTLGGQHSFVGYGLGNAGNLVINVGNLNAMEYDETAETVTFGGGARVGPVAKDLWYNHGRLMPHVRGSSVGLPGSFIGGGFGITSRFIGTPAYNLVSVRYMLPSGEIVTGGEGSDLLFAAQGAGASYGVILSMTTKTWEPVSSIAHSFNILSDGNLEQEDMLAVMLAVQDFCMGDQMPLYSSLRFHLGNSVRLSGTYFGADFTTDMGQPLIDFVNASTNVELIIPEEGNRALVTGDPWDIEIATTGSGINATNGGEVGVRAFYVQSLTFNFTMDEDIAKSILDNILYSDSPVEGVRKGGFLDFWGNGIFEEIEDTDMSHQQGKNVWLLRVDGRTNENYAVYEDFTWPEGAEVGLQTLTAPVEAAILEKGFTLRGFANYRDRMLTESQWSERLYGVNFQSLVALKDELDPTGMFNSNDQCIPNSDP